MKARVCLILAFVLCLMGCSVLAEGTYTVIATTYPLYDVAKNVCGDLADVQYVPEKTDVDADIVLYVGTEADAWVEDLEGAELVSATYGVELIDDDTDVMTIPVNCMLCALNFAEALDEIDPDNSATYQDNASAYVDLMSELDMHIREAVQEGMTISCADGSMAYFAKEYGVTVADDGAVLSTYNYPTEEQQEISYAELMHANLHALAGTED